MLNNTLKDVAGNLLQIGDKVATNNIGYKDMKIMYVIGFNPKSIKLSLTKDGEEYGIGRASRYVAKLYNQD
jgi:hypothetical protein